MQREIFDCLQKISRLKDVSIAYAEEIGAELRYVSVYPEEEEAHLFAILKTGEILELLLRPTFNGQNLESLDVRPCLLSGRKVEL